MKVFPGQKIYYVFTVQGVALPEDYDYDPDIERYKRLLVRSLFVLLQPFGFTRKDINELIQYERQSKIYEFSKAHLYTNQKEVQIAQGLI